MKSASFAFCAPSVRSLATIVCARAMTTREPLCMEQSRCTGLTFERRHLVERNQALFDGVPYDRRG